MTPEAIYTAWVEAVRAAYSEAHGARLGELHGRRSRLMDERGLHPFSVEVGRVFACQALMPELRALDFHPLWVKIAAAEDAEHQHELEIVSRYQSRRETPDAARTGSGEPRRAPPSDDGGAGSGAVPPVEG